MIVFDKNARDFQMFAAAGFGGRLSSWSAVAKRSVDTAVERDPSSKAADPFTTLG
jgi:hypothetical protein